MRWFAAALVAAWSHAEPNPVAELDSVRANLSQALEYKDQGAKERFAWELRKGQMENLILAAEEEKRNLDAALGAARPLLQELAERKASLEERRADAAAVADFLRAAAPAFAAKVLEKSRSWPEPLLDEASGPLLALRALLDETAAPVAETTLERMVQSSVEALEKALKFQNTVHLSSAFKPLPDGREALFDVVFLGLGGGYYFSDDLKLAGIIAAKEGQWEWIPQPELVDRLKTFIEIAKRERPATWIELPVQPEAEEAS